MENGIVKRVIGPVVDVQFPAGKLPEINNAIEVHAGKRRIVMEAVQQLGDNAVRCISLFSTDGLQRGCVAVDTGTSVKMPVGEATLGRMFNVIGEAYRLEVLPELSLRQRQNPEIHPDYPDLPLGKVQSGESCQHHTER